MSRGRPVGSKSKPKQIKPKPSEEYLSRQSASKEKPVQEKQTGTFQVGRMIGSEWGVYAVSRFGGRPVIVFVAQSEEEANIVCAELNETILLHFIK